MSTKDPGKELSMLLDALAEQVEVLPDAALLEDDATAKLDTKTEAERVRAFLGAAFQKAKKTRLAQASEKYTRSVRQLREPNAAIPNDPILRRQLLDASIRQRPEVRAVLTIQHRDFEKLADDDVEGMLRQLAQLGLLSTKPEP